MQFRYPFFLFAALVMTAASAFGDMVPVPNFSFENSAPGFGNPPGWTLFSDTGSPAFTSSIQVLANHGSVVSGVTGSQFVALRINNNNTVTAPGSLAGLVSGNLGIFAADTTYVLTADTGFETASSLVNVGLALGSGAPRLADVFPAADSSFASVLVNGSGHSTFALTPQTVTVNTRISAGLVGKSIDVSLIFQSEYTSGTDALFDDVTLTSTPDTAATPEPSFFGMIGILGGLGLILGQSRQARRRPN
jgi:hypothetical protein